MTTQATLRAALLLRNSVGYSGRRCLSNEGKRIISNGFVGCHGSSNSNSGSSSSQSGKVLLRSQGGSMFTLPTPAFSTFDTRHLTTLHNNNNRYFSSAALEESSHSDDSSSSRRRVLPTRHSRHSIPPICPPSKLTSYTEQLLDSKPGTLFQYDSRDVYLTPMEEIEKAWDVCDVTTQQFEFVLRGHSDMIQGSLVDRIDMERRVDVDGMDGEEYEEWLTMKQQRDDDGDGGGMDVQDRIEIMSKLVDRIEEEGKVYAELRDKLKSQVATIDAANSDDDDGAIDHIDSFFNEKDQSSSRGSDDDNDNDATEEEENNTENRFGSNPGPTTHMYDLLLDAMSLHPQPNTSERTYTILTQHILHRHEADGEDENVNPNTIPTCISYNAVMRTCANTNYDRTDTSPNSQMVRDNAMHYSFATFDHMFRCDAVQRNSATYAYMLQVLAKFIPPSKSRGNISYALFHKSTVEERVFDQNVLDSLKLVHDESNGEEFDEWLHMLLEGGKKSEAKEFPLKWRYNFRKRRHDGEDPTY